MGASSSVSGFWAVILGCCFASIASSSSSGSKYYRRAFPILQPDPDHIRLRLAREGLQAIQDITTPVAAVAVIGPYRSGKSFLLNQLLSLPCNEGFEVGHMRHAKTKGLWVWGIPVEVVIDGSKVSVLYLDTEGFENVRKSNVYDDRIFALATLISSVLIYNLPETVREADISRLSFAVEIAEEFYGRSVFEELCFCQNPSLELILFIFSYLTTLGLLICYFMELRMKGKEVVFEPAKLLWLIQRDYLQGSSVQEMVNEGLRPVPNKSGDKNIDQVNKIRKSLARMANNISAFGLPQPHLQRTKLCDMKDAELDPLYVQNREQFKQLVASIIRPKIVQGKTLNGKEFIAFLKQTLDALNKGEIPSTGSIVEVFNKAILERCLKLYNQGMSKLQLPLPENKLQLAHEVSKAEAKKLLDQQLFGRRNAKESLLKFNDEIKKDSMSQHVATGMVVFGAHILDMHIKLLLIVSCL
ncbi:uncharacterized protein LOC103982985 isoform X3 [Musa acuminata AAA Group]|uniref:uncharacterized protein LOC103982985 isoform X3 n=1 Tax=Musa acuminata AAA Group TaxID=214697 RepID=UPI0031D21449